MHDAALDLLRQALDRSAGSAIWVADEGGSEVIHALAAYRHRLTILSNRFDIKQRAEAEGIRAHFSDFDLAALIDAFALHEPQQVFYRISKERPVVHHLFNSAYRHLPEGSTLWLSGYKNEGIKTYFKSGKQLLGEAEALRKTGQIYCGALARTHQNAALLDDQDYQALRWIEPAEGDGFFSKPGTYGWNKIDQGSRFLLAQADDLLAGRNPESLRFLDLGCGYGYLTLATRHWGCARVTATDNNAAAIRCANANLEHYGIPGTVVADDCGQNLQQPYDLILCNPPFHKGFSVAGELTDRFIDSAARLLAPGGSAGFVVNAFIPLEVKARARLARRNFTVEVINNNRQFKVVALRRQ